MPARLAALRARNGTNTLKPEVALRAIPIIMLRAISMAIILSPTNMF